MEDTRHILVGLDLAHQLEDGIGLLIRQLGGGGRYVLDLRCDGLQATLLEGVPLKAIGRG